MANQITALPYGTIVRYTETPSQPKRTMLVLANGALRCLRVGEKTWKGNQLPTYPSLEAFLDIVPYQRLELFIVEFPRIDDDTAAAAERYLNTLGKAGESPEGGYVFHREAPTLTVNVPTPLLAPAPAGVNHGDKKSPRAPFQEPLTVTPPVSPQAAIPPPPWEETVTLSRTKMNDIFVELRGNAMTPLEWAAVRSFGVQPSSVVPALKRADTLVAPALKRTETLAAGPPLRRCNAVAPGAVVYDACRCGVSPGTDCLSCYPGQPCARLR